MGLATNTGANATSANVTLTANASVQSWKIIAMGQCITSGAGSAVNYMTIPSVRKDGAGNLTTFTMPVKPYPESVAGGTIFFPKGAEPLVDAQANSLVTGNYVTASTFTVWVKYEAVNKG